MCDDDLCTFSSQNISGEILRVLSSGHASLLGNAVSPCPPVKSELLNALRWWESNYQQLKFHHIFAYCAQCPSTSFPNSRV